MAIVPSNTRFVGISSSVDLREKKSAVKNNDAQPYTIEDIAETLGNSGGGGGSAPGIAPFTIEKNGPLSPWGNYSTIYYSTVGFVPNADGTQTVTPRIVPSLSFGSNPLFTFLNFVGLELANIYISSCANLQSLTFPDLTTIANGGMGAVSAGYNSSLTTVSFPSLTAIDHFSTVSFNSCALSQASVDHILVKLAGTTTPNCVVNLDGGTSAAPSAVGLAAKATLLGRGWTVSHN